MTSALAIALRASCADEVHAYGPFASHDQPGCHGIGFDMQIGAVASGPEIAFGGAAAQAFVGGELVVAGTFLLAAVEVTGARNADLLGACDEGFDQLVLCADVGDLERAGSAMRVDRASALPSDLMK
jgi:hypothetical protein